MEVSRISRCDHIGARPVGGGFGQALVYGGIAAGGLLAGVEGDEGGGGVDRVRGCAGSLVGRSVRRIRNSSLDPADKGIAGEGGKVFAAGQGNGLAGGHKLGQLVDGLAVRLIGDGDSADGEGSALLICKGRVLELRQIVTGRAVDDQLAGDGLGLHVGLVIAADHRGRAGGDGVLIEGDDAPDIGGGVLCPVVAGGGNRQRVERGLGRTRGVGEETAALGALVVGSNAGPGAGGGNGSDRSDGGSTFVRMRTVGIGQGGLDFDCLVDINRERRAGVDDLAGGVAVLVQNLPVEETAADVRCILVRQRRNRGGMRGCLGSVGKDRVLQGHAMGLLIRVKVALVVLRVVAQIANLDADDALGIHAPLGIEGDLGADVGIRLVGPGLAGNIVDTGPGAGRIDLLRLGQAEGNPHVMVEGLRAGFIQIEADQHPVIVAIIKVHALRLHQRGGLDRGAVLHGEGGLLRRAGNGDHTGAVAALVVHHNAVPLGVPLCIDDDVVGRHILRVKGLGAFFVQIPAGEVVAGVAVGGGVGLIGGQGLLIGNRHILRLCAHVIGRGIGQGVVVAGKGNVQCSGFACANRNL